MLALAKVEDAMVAAIREGVGDRVKAIDTLGGVWTLGMFRRLLQSAPAVYVASVSGRPVDGFSYTVDMTFEVFYVVANRGRDQAARRGDFREIGLYELMQATLPRLHGLTIDDVGTLRNDAVRNLFAELSLELGGTIWGARFVLPRLSLDVVTPVDLGQFKTFSSKWDLDQSQDGEPTAEGKVTLPQE